MNFEESTNPSNESEEGQIEKSALESEFSPETIEALMEMAILYGQMHNEGQNAVIFRIEVGKLPQEALKKIFTDNDKEIPTGRLATKIIKVYTTRAAANEAKNHQRVYDLLEDNFEEGMARIPEPHVHAEIDIRTETMKAKLEEVGVQVKSGKVGVMMMDYIKGIDLITHVYREILKKLPQDQFKLTYPDAREIKEKLLEDPDSIDFAKLEEAIMFALAIEGSEPGEKDEDVLRRDLSNRTKVFDAFQDLGLTIDPEILERARKTISLLNKNNIYHNDLHERNIMVEFDEDGEVVNVYLIDFDKVSGMEEESLGGDMGVVTEFKKLTKSKADQVREKKDREMQGAERFLKKLKKSRGDAWTEFRDRIDGLLDGDDEKNIERLNMELMFFVSDHGDGPSGELATGIILELAETNPDLVIKFIKYKQHNVGGGERPFVNLLTRALPRIEERIKEKE